jgi:3-hydroxyacyl-CoA dehydrogenase/enoyl-CoA hydratase/3-hydroxybutyryl-CoA epimerase
MDLNICAKALTLEYMDKNIQTTIDEYGVMLAVIDMPGRAMNVFSLAMMDSLEQLLNHVETTPSINGVVLASGKATFLVGADLDMIRMFAEVATSGTYDALHALFGRLGRLFRRMEKSTKPYVAAINGLALGGGLEVALACHERVVADDPAVQLGLPEIKLGLLPGAGGTQRLPRLIDAGEAMRMLLTGEPVSPARAMQLGLVDELVAADQLIETARRRARTLCNARAAWDIPGRAFNSAPFNFSKPDACDKIAQFVGVSQDQRSRYPAFDAIMKCVTGGWNRPMDEAWHWEMDVFVDLMRDPVAGNMVRTLFLNRLRAVKEGQAPESLSGLRIAVAGSNTAVMRALFEKGRATVIEESAMTKDDIAVVVGTSLVAGKRIAWLRDNEKLLASLNVPAGIWLSDLTEHGRSVEIVIQDGHEELADVGRKLGQWLRATILITRGRTAFLYELNDAKKCAIEGGCSQDEVMLAVALAGARAWLEGGIDDPDIADVAAVLAGIAPAYTGGPFTYLRQMGLARVQQEASGGTQCHASLFRLPENSEALFKPLAEVA